MAEAGGDAPPRQIRSAHALLRRLPLFAELPDEDLAGLWHGARRVRVPAGQLVMEEGTPADGLYIVLRGGLEVSKREGSGDVVLALRGPGDFIGEMGLVLGDPRSASARAVEESELLVIDPDAFHDLLARPAAAATLLRTMAGRLRSTQATLMEREKLASLGTLAAGLAHELNNPAAALRRSAEHLRETLDEWQRWTAALGALALTPEQTAELRRIEGALSEAGGGRAPPGAVAASLEERRLGQWLSELGIGEPWELAPPLAAGGWTVERARPLAATFPGDAFEPVLRWLASGLAGRELLDDVGRSARAISDIVRAVKTYAYLDRAPVQEVDVRESLEDTLVILRHALKGGVTVTRHFPPELPRIEAYASELNQVWTNLIDNAVHAMGGQGVLELRARVAGGGDAVEVSIIDDGPGIDPAVQARLFEPFFTTKPPGVGSGLGLHIAYNVVVNRHGGRIRCESRPGRTAFHVRLPVRLRRPQA